VTPFSTPGRILKRVTDVVGAVLLLVLASPILVGSAIAVRTTMGSPVLFRDERSGRGGSSFTLLKLRTMRPRREGEHSPAFDARRITRIGGWLRATSLDELPTLVNVVRGDMSLVGPRPLPTRYLARFSPVQARRLTVRPGVTGWAQVRGRNERTWHEKLSMDVWYVDHQTFWLDVRILLATPAAVFRREGIGHGDHATMPEFTGTDHPQAPQ
jgi:lipopolysaccharide/colanic/teichoic acid biosynthesis glycosyltransferase